MVAVGTYKEDKQACVTKIFISDVLAGSVRGFLMGSRTQGHLSVLAGEALARGKGGSLNTSLHRATAPEVQAAVKSDASYRKDTIVVFFLEAKKNKDNVKVALAFSNT